MVNPIKLTTLEDLMADVQRAADIIEVPVADITWDIMRVYEKSFTENTIGFRITTQRRRELNVRYQTLIPQDPYSVAVEHGFLTPTDHPVYALTPELMRHRPEAGYFIDLGVTHGFEKIWGFFTNPFSVEEVCALESMPSSVPGHMDLFKKHGLNWIGIVAVNYPARTTNLYWMDGSFDTSPEIAAQIVVDSGFPKPADVDNVFNSQGLGMYMTFSWDSDAIERISFCQGGPAEAIPAHWPPLVRKFAAEVPLHTDDRNFALCTAYGPDRANDYYKIEGDYHNTIKSILGPVIGGSIQARKAAAQG